MAAVRTRFEVRVNTLVNQTTLAAFGLPLSRIPLPRHRRYRLSVATAHDVPTVLSRLAQHDVEIVELRQCTAPPRRAAPPAPQRAEETSPAPAAEAPPDGVVLPFHRRRWTGAPSSGVPSPA
jgi:hypothetical protein